MNIKINKINHIIVFGGSFTAFKILKYLQSKNYKYDYFTNYRQLKDILPNNLTLEKNLKLNNIPFIKTENINKNKLIFSKIKKTTLGLGLGQPWEYEKNLLKKFRGNLVDFMGIPMPMYRGGAHYSWMIMNNNKNGGCFLQNVNEYTKQGSADSNFYFLKKEYKYKKNLKLPKDYFNYSSEIETKFLIKFLKSTKKGKIFKLKEFNRNNSIFFPRLKSQLNSFINWTWDIEEIVKFINAFSDPYPGAITFLNKKKIFLKNAKVYIKNNFHSFTSGIITNKIDNKIFICAKGGIIETNFMLSKKNLVKHLKIGMRFDTNTDYINKGKKHIIF